MATSVHMKCLEAIATRLQGLSLSGIASASIVAQWNPLAHRFQNTNGETPELALPGIVIWPSGSEIIPPEAGTNYRDSIGYPCAVTIIATQDMSALASDMDARLVWRSRCIGAFRAQRLPNVPEVVQAFVEPQTIVDAAAWLQGFWSSSFLVRCNAREARG